VLASFVESMLVTHDTFIGGLPGADRDRFVREWEAVGALMGLPRRLGWPDAAALRDYVEAEIASGRALPGPGSRLVAGSVLHPPLPSPLLRPAADLLAFAAAGLLPGRLRSGYGIPWTPAHAAAHRGLRLWLRALRSTLPERFRTSAVYDRALARAGGRWPHRQAA
jgi:uncharacterized protein (DUF2236 family)